MQAGDAQVGAGYDAAGGGEHLFALVDTHAVRGRVSGRDVTQRLAGARAEVENRARLHLTCGLRDNGLQRLVVGNLGPHHLETGVGIEVELLGHRHHLRPDSTERIPGYGWDHPTPVSRVDIA